MLFTNPTAAAAVIFCHGSGDTGPGVREYLAAVGNPESRLREAGIELHCPSARPIPYRLAGGQRSSVWFDRYELEPSAPEHVESVAAREGHERHAAGEQREPHSSRLLKLEQFSPELQGSRAKRVHQEGTSCLLLKNL